MWLAPHFWQHIFIGSHMAFRNTLRIARAGIVETPLYLARTNQVKTPVT